MQFDCRKTENKKKEPEENEVARKKKRIDDYEFIIFSILCA